MCVSQKIKTDTLREKVSKYGVFSNPYFPVLGLNTGKYGPEKPSYLDTFHAVRNPSLFLEQSSICLDVNAHITPIYNGYH